MRPSLDGLPHLSMIQKFYQHNNMRAHTHTLSLLLLTIHMCCSSSNICIYVNIVHHNQRKTIHSMHYYLLQYATAPVFTLLFSQDIPPLNRLSEMKLGCLLRCWSCKYSEWRRRRWPSWGWCWRLPPNLLRFVALLDMKELFNHIKNI